MTETESQKADSQDIVSHYQRVDYTGLATLDIYPAIGKNDDAGWYIKALSDREEFTEVARPAIFYLDSDTLTQRVDRCIYSTTSYKDPESLGFQHCVTGKGTTQWENDENPMPGYEALRGLSVWGDIDLCDGLKLQRDRLDDRQKGLIEEVLTAYGEEFAKLVGGQDAVYALDSVGGAYFFTAPEITLPIADHFDDDDARARVFKGLVDRSNRWLKQAQERVEDRISDAATVINPDWVNNVNRAYKAPLSLHSYHDAVVMPLDPANPDYTMMPLSAVGEREYVKAADWGESLTKVEYTDRVSTLVEQLWPEYADVDDWKTTLDEWVADTARPNTSTTLHQRSSHGNRAAEYDRSKLDIVELVKKYCKEWEPNGNKYHFNPGHHLWKDSDSGRTCRVFPKTNTFVDVGNDDWYGGGGPLKFLALVFGHLDSPAGSFDRATTFKTWLRAKQEGLLPENDRIPARALVYVALEANLCETDDIVDGWKIPDQAYNKALEYVQKQYDADPGRNPIERVRLDWEPLRIPHELRRRAWNAEIDWPTTEDYHDRNQNALEADMMTPKNILRDAPTASGKSYPVATTSWRNFPEITGGQPVVHLHDNNKARDQAAADSAEAGVDFHKLRARDDIADDGEPICPVAAGEHDHITMNGEVASAWLERQCDKKGLQFALARSYLAQYNDQNADLPEYTDQWSGIPRDDDGNPVVDVIHASKQFAYVKSLRQGTNIVLDELTSYEVDEFYDNRNSQPDYNRIKTTIEWFLRQVDAPISTFERFVSIARNPGPELQLYLGTEIAIQKHVHKFVFLQYPAAHALAPAITRAIWRALKDEPDQNGRYAAHVETDDDATVSIVMDRQHKVRRVRHVPDFSTARSVICLEADPTHQLWELNTGIELELERVDTPEERRLWRTFERNLTVVQIGDYRRPVGTAGRYFQKGQATVMFQAISEFSGGELRAQIAPSSVEDEVNKIAADAGVESPLSMHPGATESRNDFEGLHWGLVHRCLDPGDDPVLDTLAELDADARPEYFGRDVPCPKNECEDGCDSCLCNKCAGDGCPKCQKTGRSRARGRGFHGPDDELATQLVEAVSVSRNMQAVGRWARKADGHAIVFVDSNVLPGDMVDIELRKPQIYGQKTISALEVLATEGALPTPDLAEKADCTNTHITETLADLPKVTGATGMGPNGSTRWQLDAEHLPLGELDFGRGKIRNEALQNIAGVDNA